MIGVKLIGIQIILKQSIETYLMRSIVFSATKTFQNHFVFYFFVTERLQFKSLNKLFLWGRYIDFIFS